MIEHYIITSSENKEILFNLPWSSTTVGTESISLKEFTYDNCIENVEENLKIGFYEGKKEKYSIDIEKGSYELTTILDLINVKLDQLKFKDFIFLFNYHNGKFDVTNNSKKYDIVLSEYTSNYFRLPNVIQMGKRFKSHKMFELMNIKSLFIRVKDLRNGIHTNELIKGNGQIIFESTITSDYGQTKVHQINTNNPDVYYFHNNRINEVVINITDKFGRHVNIQNIKLKLVFSTTRL